MTVHTESALESSIEAHLLDHGWHTLDPQTYSKTHGLFADEFLTFLQTSQPEEFEELVRRLGGEDKARTRIVERVVSELKTRGTIDVLRGRLKMNGVTFRACFFKPANNLTPVLLDQYAANRLGVVRQLHHSESRPADSLDLVLTVNGIPTATAELKNPLTQQSAQHAMAQYRTDRNPADLIFSGRALVHFAVDPHRVYMTTKLAKDETLFLPFNQGSNGPGNAGGDGNPASDGYQTAYLWEQVWQRDAWLDLLGSFVHAEDGQILFPRFHQWHAVRSIVAATYDDGAGTDRLIQHSAGSGKSNTIAWTAHALSRLHDVDDQPVFDKVVVITDRVVLDRQLQETVAGLDHTPGTIQRIDKHSGQLRDALRGHTARVVITTLQKFPVISEIAGTVAGKRFAIIVDEAHSSTTGEAMKQLKKVLGTGEAALDAAEQAEVQIEAAVGDTADALFASAEARGRHQNLSFFAFTATPKPKTRALFGQLQPGPDGEDVYAPFHLYSMRQAIEEGFILDVLRNYTTYATYYKLANAEPDDPEVPVSKARAALARFASLHPANLAQKSEIIVEHFRQKTAARIDGQAKAMVVTRSRLHAVRYKQAIDAYIKAQGYDRASPPVRALVAFSGTLNDPDADELTYTESMMNGFSEGQLPKQFAGPEYHLLVVAEKYQTGFDQPLLHTMYVDKPLAGVKAVQTLSRLNRTHPGKQDTFVLDFANDAEQIRDAFSEFFEGSLATPTDPNELYTLQRRIEQGHIIDPDEMSAAVTALLSGEDRQQAAFYGNLSPAVRRFAEAREQIQDEFREAVTAYVRAYAFLAQVMSWTDPELEELFLYCKALALELPTPEGEPLPLVSNKVQLTHLRIATTLDEADVSLTEGTDDATDVFPGGGAGRQNDTPMDRLSALIATMNERFGMDLGEPDKLYLEQQKAAVLEDDDLRVIAMHNDRDQYEEALAPKATDLIVERHQSNQVLFDAFFANPAFQKVLIEYLATTYDDFRSDTA